MKVLILTSADHLYANYILKALLLEGVFSQNEIKVFEQNSIIPKKGKIEALKQYLKTSGFKYVFFQALKIYIFKLRRSIAGLVGNKKSSYFPYWKIKNKDLKRMIVNNIDTPKIVSRIKKINPDIIISLFSKEYIPQAILKIPKFGCINLHPAKLPFYKGVSPTFWVLANGEKETGVTLHYIDKKIDTGEIIAQKVILINKQFSEHELYMKCSIEGKKLLKNFLLKLPKKRKNPNKKPMQRPGSYFSLPTKDAVEKFSKNGYKFFKINEFSSTVF